MVRQSEQLYSRAHLARHKPSLLRRVLRFGTLAALALVLFALFYRIEALTYRTYVQDQRLTGTLRMTEVREQVRAEIFSRILGLTELATVIGENPQINQTEFNIKALDFLLAHPDVINIAAAPDQVVTMVFPRTGNEAVLGLNYRTNAAQYPKVARALETGEGQITGPVNLIQGGRGLILRQPVFVQHRGARSTPWGILSVVLDYDKFITDLGVPALEKEFDLLIQDSAGPGEVRDVLLGDPAVMARDPILLDIKFPFGNWTLAATPDGGWPTHKPNYLTRWLLLLAVALAALGGLYYVMRLSDIRRAAEQHLTNGIEALSHGFVMYDAEGRLVTYNRPYKNLHGATNIVRLGVTYQEVLRDSIAKGLVPDAVGREHEWMTDWFAQLTDGVCETEQHLPDGRVIKTSDRRMEDGSIVGLRIDVTDLKKAQHAAETANKAKTDFMGVLSHELRTPLTVILGHARLGRHIRKMPAARALETELITHPDARAALTPKLEALYDQVDEMMSKTARSGDHLLMLINEILDYAKIDSGSLSVVPAETDVDEILQPVLDQMRPHIEGKGLTLEVDHAPLTLHADAKRVRQVLINLLGNASKFTETGSISLEVRETANTVDFRVTDSGIGIPEDEIENVFEAFHQVDASATRQHGGTGLGLAISRDIARAHGGDLTASSEIGAGSVFTLSLPHVGRAARAPLGDSDADAEQPRAPSKVA